MAVLPENLVKEFVKITNDDKKEKKETFLYGTVHIADNHMDVLLDGAQTSTPCTTTVTVEDGDRVLVMLKNREAVITANISNPSINVDVLEGRIVRAKAQYIIYMVQGGEYSDEINVVKMTIGPFDGEDDRTVLTFGEAGVDAVFDSEVWMNKHVTFRNFGATYYVDQDNLGRYIDIGYTPLAPSNLRVAVSSPAFKGPNLEGATFYGAIQTPSDRSLKHDIKDTDETDALGKLNAIRHRKYVWNKSGEDETLGYISQELRDIDPKLVTGPDGMCAINNLHLIALATKAIQELSAKVDKLERRVEELESERN